MALKLFNTLSRSVEEFAPLDPAGKKVGMYCCGPTVHDAAHIGNFRTFVFADLVRRYLEFKGFAVRHVMNITDVEDKIIKRVQAAGISLREYTAKYETAFFDDLKTLGCRMPQETPRATEFIPDIVALVEKLMARGLAYLAADGSVYFSIEKYRAAGATYGQLVKLNFEEMRVGERVRHDEYAKEAVADFALWKARVPEDGAVHWTSPWGDGRPGWHIECSAMSMKLLGPAFDLHLGGEDLVFPHHEDEIAQSEGAGLQPAGGRFVKHWMHGAHLLVEGKKMSKSLGNFYVLGDLTAKGFSGREVRFALLQAHYRETFNFTLEGLQNAQKALRRIEECVSKLYEFWDQTLGDVEVIPDPRDVDLMDQFQQTMDDDLNISRSWGLIFDWIRELNKLIAGNNLTKTQAASALATLGKLDGVLGIGFKTATAMRMSLQPGIVGSGKLAAVVKTDTVPDEIVNLFRQRMDARKAKDFKRADAIRDELKAKGWAIEDTPKGARLKRI